MVQEGLSQQSIASIARERLSSISSSWLGVWLFCYCTCKTLLVHITMATPPASPPPPSLLLNLDPDALRAVLLRTCAADHANLRLTCSKVRDVLDSPIFWQERCESDYAEVKTVLMTPLEDYTRNVDDTRVDEEIEMMREDDGDRYFRENYDDFGFRDPDFFYRRNRARIFVDGKKAGLTGFTILLRRSSPNSIHEIADLISLGLQEITTKFFDRKGRPRLASLKQALGTQDTRDAGFLYINNFHLKDPAYRTTSLVGAKALRSLFGRVMCSAVCFLKAPLSVPLSVRECRISRVDDHITCKLFVLKASEFANRGSHRAIFFRPNRPNRPNRTSVRSSSLSAFRVRVRLLARLFAVS